MNWLVAILLIVWVYVLTVMKRAKLGFWYYICGSVGMFVFSLIVIEPHVVGFLQSSVSAVAGVIGSLTGLYESYFQEGLLFIDGGGAGMSLYIDFECSGVIEMMAFLSLLWFFPVYNVYERFAVSVIGCLSIFAANVLRIFSICLMIHIWGIDIYFFAHTIFARILFYGCTVFLYFYVFTKPQIVRQKVGAFRYDSN